MGTFVTESDLGIGTIVGSAVFNIFGVIAVCGLFTGERRQQQQMSSVDLGSNPAGVSGF
jgi:Ca2+/Na+ antiporter